MNDFDNITNVYEVTESYQINVRIAVTVISAIIFVIGVTGNFLVIATILRVRKMRATQNMLFGNLAVGDFVSIIWCLPTFIVTLCVPWPYGEFACKYIFPLNHIITFDTVFTMVSIMLYRYRAIVYPLKKKPTMQVTLLIIAISWIVGYLFIALPYAFSTKLLKDHTGTIRCVTFRKDALTIFHQLTFVLTFFCVPCIATLFFVSRVKSKIRRNMKFARGSLSNQLALRRSKAHHRMIKMLVVIVISFVICFLPFNTLLIIAMFNLSLLSSSASVIVIVSCSYILIFINSTINPVILYMMSNDFRKGYLKQLKCFTSGRCL